MTVLTLPRLGETMEEARVTRWLVAPGAAFQRGDVLLEVETDKTVVEVPALQGGVLAAQLVAEGDMVALGAPIAEVAGDVADAPARPAASPRARALARAAGVDLAGLSGSGRRRRITGEDVARQAPAGGMAPPAPGEAATVVLLHGLYDTPQGWRDLPRRLAAAGFAVAAPPLPAEAGVEGAVRALAAALPAGRLRLAGHSLGAVLAARLAAELGPLVEALVLLAPAGLGPRLNADFLAGMAHANTPAALARTLALLGGDPLSPQALAGELARLQAARPGMAALAQEVADHGVQQTDIAALLAGLALPITAVFGLNDRIIDWHDCARLPARAAIHLLAGSGHLPHAADPDLILDLLTAPSRPPP